MGGVLRLAATVREGIPGMSLSMTQAQEERLARPLPIRDPTRQRESQGHLAPSSQFPFRLVEVAGIDGERRGDACVVAENGDRTRVFEDAKVE